MCHRINNITVYKKINKTLASSSPYKPENFVIFLYSIKYRVLGIVRKRKLSQLTFIDVVCKKKFAGSPILCSPDN